MKVKFSTASLNTLKWLYINSWLLGGDILMIGSKVKQVCVWRRVGASVGLIRPPVQMAAEWCPLGRALVAGCHRDVCSALTVPQQMTLVSLFSVQENTVNRETHCSGVMLKTKTCWNAVVTYLCTQQLICDAVVSMLYSDSKLQTRSLK